MHKKKEAHNLKQEKEALAYHISYKLKV